MPVKPDDSTNMKTSSILTTHALTSENLKDIATGERVATVVRSFVDPIIAERISGRLLANGYETYLNAPSIGRIGMAFYEAEARVDLVSEYFSVSQANIDRLRSACLPYASPIDTLRCKLDELWEAGAHLERIYGKTMFVGLSRVLSPQTTFLAHHDYFEKDAPDSGYAASLIGQLACNVYLSVPSKGGYLQIWDREMSPSDFDSIRGDSYGIDPRLLGEPDLTIHPGAGDLIVFNARKMHAVSPPEDAPRLSLSCFVGYRGSHMPLTYWS